MKAKKTLYQIRAKSNKPQLSYSSFKI